MTHRRPHPDLDLALERATFVVFDCEMTGLRPRTDRIVAVAAVRVRHGAVTDETFDRLVRPDRAMSHAAAQVTGLRDEDLAIAPPPTDVLPAFRSFIGRDVPVAHVAAFDLEFLAPALRRVRVASLERVVDTASLAVATLGAHVDASLEALAARFDLSLRGRHTALGDARLAGRLLIRLLPAAERRGARTVRDLLEIADAHDAVRRRPYR